MDQERPPEGGKGRKEKPSSPAVLQPMDTLVRRIVSPANLVLSGNSEGEGEGEEDEVGGPACTPFCTITSPSDSVRAVLSPSHLLIFSVCSALVLVTYRKNIVLVPIVYLWFSRH